MKIFSEDNPARRDFERDIYEQCDKEDREMSEPKEKNWSGLKDPDAGICDFSFPCKDHHEKCCKSYQTALVECKRLEHLLERRYSDCKTCPVEPIYIKNKQEDLKMNIDREDCQEAPTHELDNMETYIGCKIIQAIPMDECRFLARKGEDVSSRETRPGYMVRYPDGYMSWSPKNVFEEAYRKINASELSMCR